MRRVLNALLAAAAMSSVACGGYGMLQNTGPKDPDPYLGAVDPTAYDVKFQASTSKTACGTTPTPCYPIQQGYAGGAPVYFYNLGTVPVASLPKDANGKNQLASSVATNQVYDFPTACTPSGTFDIRVHQFARDVQYPIFSAIPLASTSSSVLVLPLAQVHTVSGLSGNTCNDLKTADSINDGKYGAQPSSSVDFQLRAAVDPTANFAPAPNAANVLAGSLAWYKGLTLSHISGGSIPVDAAGNLQPMEGAIVTYGGTAAKPTDPKVIILPAAPGAPGFVPVVRLHEFTAPTGKTAGSYTGICATPPSCAGTEVDITTGPQATKVTNLLFIVGSAQ